MYNETSGLVNLTVRYMRKIKYFILLVFAPLGVFLLINTNEFISWINQILKINVTREEVALSYLLLGIIIINALAIARRKNKNANNI